MSLKRLLWIILVVVLVITGCRRAQPTPTPTQSPTPQPTASPAPTSAPTATTTPPPPSVTASPPPASPTPQPSPTPSFFLKVTQPSVESVVTTPQLTVKGVTVPDAVVSVNGQKVAVDTTGAFTTDVTLQPGPNSIEVVASDFSGNSQSVVLSAIYTP